MKNIKLLTITIISISFLCYGGGDIKKVTPYETNDVELATENAEPETYIKPIEEPIKVEPTPIIIKEHVKVVPPPSKKEINPSGFYVGLGITGSRYYDTCKCTNNSITQKISNKENNMAVLGRVGYDYNPYIGVEARGIISFAEDEDMSLSHTGLFIKPMIPLGDITNLYTLLGFAKTRVKGANTPHLNAESMAFGGGLEFDLSKDIPKDGIYSRKFDGKGNQEKGIGFFLDYERLVAKKHAPQLDAFSAGVTYDF